MKSPLHTVLLLHLMGIFTGDTQVSQNSSPRQDRFLGNELTLDMALESFDDQYEGCEQTMEKEMARLKHLELLKNKIYAKAWNLATRKMRAESNRPRNLRPEYATAIKAYTLEDDKLYPDFNAAVRKAGQSEEHYRNNFDFKTFHFLLTRALQDLRASSAPRPPCYKVFRGVSNIHFSATVKDTVRFGQFTSSSLQERVAQGFAVGQPAAKTIFEICTCHGVPISKFSAIPSEAEVLIPPYEQFEVVSSRKDEDGTTRLELHSAGKFSRYNCLYTSGSLHDVSSSESSDHLSSSGEASSLTSDSSSGAVGSRGASHHSSSSSSFLTADCFTSDVEGAGPTFIWMLFLLLFYCFF